MRISVSAWFNQSPSPSFAGGQTRASKKTSQPSRRCYRSIRNASPWFIVMPRLPRRVHKTFGSTSLQTHMRSENQIFSDRLKKNSTPALVAERLIPITLCLSRQTDFNKPNGKSDKRFDRLFRILKFEIHVHSMKNKTRKSYRLRKRPGQNPPPPRNTR